MIKRIDNRGVLHQVVEHGGVLHVGGIVADDPTLDMFGQTMQVLTKLARVLDQNGSGVDRILSMLVFITDMKSKPEMNRAWSAFFRSEDLPARATLGITAIEEGVRIEVVATAARR